MTPILLERPAVLHIGDGTLPELGRWARARGVQRPLVVTGRSGAARVALLDLPGEVTVFADTKPEPDLPNLLAACALAERAQPDCVIGFGGGSAMDLAKLVAVLPGSGQSLHDVAGPEKVHGRRVLLAQVPTTAGTGSEAGTRALVTDPATRNKVAVQSRHMLADIAVVDATLTHSVPPDVTAATGLDALAHCIECFTSRKSHPVVDLHVLEGIRLVGRFLHRAVTDGADAEARAGLMLASLYGGFGLGPVNTTSGHAIAYPLGTRHHLPHGLACALIMPHALAVNAPAAPDKTALVLDALGGDVTAFCASLGLDMRLRAHAIPQGDLPAMAKEAHAIRRLLDNNPRDMSEGEILALYERAF